MHNLLFGSHRNLNDVTLEAYNSYLDKQYKEKGCWCGVTPNMFAPAFQALANKFLGIESYEEWKVRMEAHNAFIVNYRLTEDAVIVSRPPSTEPPVARRAMAPWEIL